MKVVIDDQLMLLANLGALEWPDEVERPLLTVYAFQLRAAAAVAVQRTTEGSLQRVVQEYLRDGADPATLVRAESDAVRVMDPTDLVVQTSGIRSALRCNILAAEVVSAAQAENAHVALTPGNADGHLFETLRAAEVPTDVWTLVPTESGFAVEMREALPGRP